MNGSPPEMLMFLRLLGSRRYHSGGSSCRSGRDQMSHITQNVLQRWFTRDDGFDRRQLHRRHSPVAQARAPTSSRNTETTCSGALGSISAYIGAR